jgi:hypothetical protein
MLYASTFSTHLTTCLHATLVRQASAPVSRVYTTITVIATHYLLDFTARYHFRLSFVHWRTDHIGLNCLMVRGTSDVEKTWRTISYYITYFSVLGWEVE